MTYRTISYKSFKFDCPIAATAPNTIDAIDINTIIVCHWSIKFTNGIYKNLINC